MEKRTGGRAAPTTVSSLVRTREYLTGREIERLMAAARKGSRWGHRDATMILIGYRHGLRASELCDLQWSQVELSTGALRSIPLTDLYMRIGGNSKTFTVTAILMLADQGKLVLTSRSIASSRAITAGYVRSLGMGIEISWLTSPRPLIRPSEQPGH